MCRQPPRYRQQSPNYAIVCGACREGKQQGTIHPTTHPPTHPLIKVCSHFWLKPCWSWLIVRINLSCSSTLAMEQVCTEWQIKFWQKWSGASRCSTRYVREKRKGHCPDLNKHMFRQHKGQVCSSFLTPRTMCPNCTGLSPSCM